MLLLFYQVLAHCRDRLKTEKRKKNRNRINQKYKQDCSYQGEALNVPTASHGLWS